MAALVIGGLEYGPTLSGIVFLTAGAGGAGGDGGAAELIGGIGVEVSLCMESSRTGTMCGGVEIRNCFGGGDGGGAGYDVIGIDCMVVSGDEPILESSTDWCC